MEIKEKINNVTSKVISNIWAKLEQISFDFTFKNGKTERLTHEVYGRNDGVAVLLYNPLTKKVILSKQFRIPMYVANVKNGFSIEVVGGAIDANESPETTVIRETKEEVGYSIDNPQKVTTVFLSPGLMWEQVHLYVSEYSNEDKIEKGEGLIEEGEEIEVLETSFEDALQMIENEEIVDARTILLLQYLRINELID
ncbi:NUDIX domain-containing protein [Polaribacter sp. R77954]|uniref:NUDIX domain-containing protein n=1 Tax=Polaribacter sp. R77954 TaxID=3093870 RepID=UPI0037C65128